MAIQVSGTEVISNSRALSNIASVDATTAASITAAGVGGGANEWTTLSNTYSFNYNMVSGTQNSGWLDASTILTGMPSDFKYFMFMIKGTLSAPTASSWYGYFENSEVELRIGSSSSNYTTFSDLGNPGMAGVFYPPVYQSGYYSRKYGYVVIAKSSAPTLPTTITYNQPASALAVNKGVQRSLAPQTSLLPELTTSYSDEGWNIEQVEGYVDATGFNHSGGTDYNYLAVKLSNVNYASQNGTGGTLSWQVSAAYVPA